MRYFLKYWWYILIGVLFSGLFSLVLGNLHYELIPVFSVLLFILRVLDDYFDYDTDTKEKIISKKALLITAIVLSLIFVALNVVFFGLYGLLSAIILIYMLIQNKIDILKILFLPVFTVFYILQYTVDFSVPAIVLIVASVAISVFYYIYKGKKRNDN